MKKIAVLIAGMAMCFMAHAAASKPNIVVIFNDDMGYADIGCFGSEKNRTPRIDKMAEEGRRFTDFYVASAVCSASRAALLTGCYPQRVGVPGVFFPNKQPARGLDPEHFTIAELLKSAGYKTLAAGKWHLGDEPRFLPTNQGFDTFYGVPYSNDMYPAKSMKYADDCLYREGITPGKIEAAFAETPAGKQPRTMKDKVPLMRDEVCIEFPLDQSTITRRLADESIRFIEESVKEGKPFFIYLTNPMPHTPLFASSQFDGKSANGLYGDVIEEIDFNAGRVLDALKANGVDDNTLVIFTSDNGPWLIKRDHGGSAKPLRDGKGSSYEGGQRVPCVMRWPGKIKAGTECAEIATAMDLLPTFAAITGTELPSDLKVKPDGHDIQNLMTGGPKAKSPYAAFCYSGSSGVRVGAWKYRYGPRYGMWSGIRPKENPREKQLFNLADDIGEQNNRIEQHPEVTQRLVKALEDHIYHVSFPDGGDDVLPEGDFENLGDRRIPQGWQSGDAPEGVTVEVSPVKDGGNTFISLSRSGSDKGWTALKTREIRGLDNATYTATFRAKAVGDPVTVKVFFLNPWSWHKAKDFALTNEWQTYTHSAVADTLGEFRKTMFVRMDMQSAGTVLIDDVKLSFER